MDPKWTYTIKRPLEYLRGQNVHMLPYFLTIFECFESVFLQKAYSNQFNIFFIGKLIGTIL